MSSTGITFTLGNYTFSPAPVISINKSFNRSGSGELFSITNTIEIQGVLTSLVNCTFPGFTCTMNEVREMQAALERCGCMRLRILCGTSEMLDAMVRITSVNFGTSQDNWVFSIPYTITAEWLTTEDNTDPSGVVFGDRSCLHCLTNIQETWDIQELDGYKKYDWDPAPSGTCKLENPRYFSVSHSVSANAVNCCSSGGVQSVGWQVARDWVNAQLGIDASVIGDVSISNFNPASFTFYDHSRIRNIDEKAGGFSVTETWIGVEADGDIRGSLEDFTIDCTTSSDTRLTTYTINGTITGLETRNGSFQITKTKYQSAVESWALVEPLLIKRINCLSNPICTVHPRPVSKQVGRNPSQGVITYSYTYNDRPPSLIAGSISEDISISDVKRAEQISVIPVLGRVNPLLRSCGTSNETTRTVSITIVMPYTACPSPSGTALCTRYTQLYNQIPETAVNTFLCCLQTQLTNSYQYVGKNSDSSQWNPITGVYNRNVSWIFENCDSSLPGGFC